MKDIVLTPEVLVKTSINGAKFSPAMKLVYFLLMSSADKEGNVQIKQTDIEKMLSLSRPAIWKYISALVGMGLISKSGQTGNDGLYYRVLPIRGIEA
ncbi:hypothetical protein [Pectobacterium brasiliense]|uniref:hypothetical protein n=1 Tax=Pectobacterium brasiliense TaxID=180957 RepID=UPI001968EE72|nr:hypothetical protein [Pectobacterium brasiliense]MBN3123218.1 hypothetical protein [Pectobacterium brasiliense]